MGIAIFKFFIWGGISPDIRSEITFYGSADASPLNEISDRISNDIPPRMHNWTDDYCRVLPKVTIKANGRL